jgi:hypothetical protein
MSAIANVKLDSGEKLILKRTPDAAPNGAYSREDTFRSIYRRRSFTIWKVEIPADNAWTRVVRWQAKIDTVAGGRQLEPLYRKRKDCIQQVIEEIEAASPEGKRR